VKSGISKPRTLRKTKDAPPENSEGSHFGTVEGRATRPPTQDGRALRRYKRRWIVERTFSWLGNYRRLTVRYDRSLTIYRGFFHIACFMIVLRRVLK
jgi:transposase